MEKLKSILADKIIEVSSSEVTDIKSRLDKINRFRDFAEACQSLMDKYPEIEDELIRMVKNNDFDAKVAASRVDTIIRLHQEKTLTEHSVEEDISNRDENIESSVDDFEQFPEDIDYEEVSADDTTNNKEYAEFEDVDETLLNETSVNKPEFNDDGEDDTEPITRNETVKKVVQAIGVILAIGLFIFLVVFIMNNWKTVLWVLSGLMLVVFVIWFLKRKYKK